MTKRPNVVSATSSLKSIIENQQKLRDAAIKASQELQQPPTKQEEKQGAQSSPTT